MMHTATSPWNLYFGSAQEFEAALKQTYGPRGCRTALETHYSFSVPETAVNPSAGVRITTLVEMLEQLWWRSITETLELEVRGEAPPGYEPAHKISYILRTSTRGKKPKLVCVVKTSHARLLPLQDITEDTELGFQEGYARLVRTIEQGPTGEPPPEKHPDFVVYLNSDEIPPFDRNYLKYVSMARGREHFLRGKIPGLFVPSLLVE